VVGCFRSKIITPFWSQSAKVARHLIDCQIRRVQRDLQVPLRLLDLDNCTDRPSRFEASSFGSGRLSLIASVHVLSQELLEFAGTTPRLRHPSRRTGRRLLHHTR
jgi:hypothetical protein